MRLPLDIQFVFTANPEDYTNRGSIVTPLKDRIESQILTHYPPSIELSKRITLQEAKILDEQHKKVEVPDLVHDILEQVAIEGRRSEYVDAKSGVSARMTISAYESLVGQAERRAVRNKEKHTYARIADLYTIIQSIVGKMELVYEGEQEGAANVAKLLIGKSVRTIFPVYFPNPELFGKRKEKSPYLTIAQWFSNGNYLELSINSDQVEYERALISVPGLAQLVKSTYPDAEPTQRHIFMELILFAMVEYSLISKHEMEGDRLAFKDLMTGMFSLGPDDGIDS
jgi:magnesium chelatase subunit I